MGFSPQIFNEYSKKHKKQTNTIVKNFTKPCAFVGKTTDD